MSMHWPAVGILIVAAITPGPNNILAMNAGMRGGARAAIPVISGVLSGSLALFLLIELGLEAAVKPMPMAAAAIAAAGALYLAWLGLSLVTAAEGAVSTESRMPASPAGVAAFQLMNPKGWVMMSVFAAATHEVGDRAIKMIVLIGVFAACLSIWAGTGAALSRLLRNASGLRLVNRMMGTALIVFAAAIALQQMHVFASASGQSPKF